MDLQLFFSRTLKKFQISKFSLGFKEDWQPSIEWIVQEELQGKRYSFYYAETLTVLFEVNKSLTEEELAYFQDLFEIIFIKKSVYYKENEIQKLQEGLQAIVTNEKVESLLENILQNAVVAIPAASTGILTLYNEQTKILENIATVGLNKKIRHAKFQIGEAIVGKIFAEGESKLFTNRAEIAQYFNDVSEKNLAILAPEEKLYQSSGLIAVPIKLSEKTVGVILLHQQKKQWSFSELDVKTMEHFASQMALAIFNARIYQQLQERENYLSIRNQIHDTLMSLSLSNKGIPAIVKEIQSILQMALIYYDFIYYEEIQTNPSKRDDKFFDELFKKIQVYPEGNYVEMEGDAFYAQPIILDHFIIAALVVEAKQEISETNRMVLEQCAMMISNEILKKQSLMDRYLKHNQEFFHRISSVPSTEAIQLLNQKIDYHFNQSFCMIVVMIAQEKHSISSELELHKLIVAIEKQLRDYGIFLFGTNNQITIFVPYNDWMEFKTIKQEISTLISNFSIFFRVPLYAGISTGQRDLAYIKKLTDEAQKACDYGARNQNTSVISYDSLGINTLFLTQSKEYIESFINEIFDPLSQERNDLANTLRAYVACNTSPKETANQLFIHINTLYQRLGKIEKILNLSFDNREHLLRIQLACYLYDNHLI
ncbi:helix-turn-helix domain-containing protein [Lysinibacillus sp. NPDC059133]|uniref:helix-turn-helix domain-containing protein n=1 Tax=Lysinibacillus sp. NPDC059133 TaxID=3346737 RepID=UPI0036843806